ncbi:unnamed protein product [Durusdinium trenchii]|uniref:Cap-specific mRNA (nucleoside-2'-O-)-methyltransferase n=1 Tax=Durusdinium trenchii TaxID=1381693 RepID=A0ABP0JTB0_9DINO
MAHGRLHYRWSQLEADKSGLNVGSPVRPWPKVDRTLALEPKIQRGHDAAREKAFGRCKHLYKCCDYNTFYKNGSLKLTEVELFFLSSHMSKDSSRDWAVVYLGVGNGERFRFLRDEFFPHLTVVAFDPLDKFYTGSRSWVWNCAQRWNQDGSNFSFYVRCFNVEEDIPMIREMTNGKRLLMISDIRGVALTDDEHFDKVQDQEVQWQAIQALQPESSLVKFALPHVWEQFYDYAPGVLLKQTFCNFGTLELRLLVSGVPAKRYSYDGWDIVEKMTFHHEHLRGQVYSSGLRPKCLDGCFDCSVLMETLAAYASKSSLELASITDSLLKFHVYYCSGGEEWEKFSWIPPSIIERWQVVLWGLKRGNLSEAILALEVEAKEGEEDLDACLAGFMVPHHSS